MGWKTTLRPIVTIAVPCVLWFGCGGTEPAPTKQPGAEADPAAAQLQLVDDGVGRVVARVGEGVVSESEFLLAAARRPPSDGKKLSMEERMTIVQELAIDDALWQEAVKRGLYRDAKVRNLMVRSLLKMEVHDKVHGSDFSVDVLKSYFKEHEEDFVIPEKVQLKRIFIAIGPERDKAAALSFAQDLHVQLEARPDQWRELAIEHSQDTYRRRGGDVGYVARDGKAGLEPEVVKRAFELELKELDEPFVAGEGVHILMVMNHRKEVRRTFEQMKGSVIRKLKHEKHAELSEAFLVSIKDGYPVKVDDEALAAVDLMGEHGAAKSPEGAAPGSPFGQEDGAEASEDAPLDDVNHEEEL
jgi:hypothetical protein